MNELITLLIASTPVFELRAAIPIAQEIFDFAPAKAYIISVVGNLIPVVLLLTFLPSVSAWLSRHSKWCEKIINWVFGRYHKKHSRRFDNAGALALFFLTAIPLPMTGAWMASVLAFLFNIPFRKAFAAIAAGVIVAGLLVLGILQGILLFF